MTMHYLAVTLTDTRQFREAETLHRKLLPIRRRKLGPEHSDTLRTMQYLAVTCGELGKKVEARGLYESLLPTQRQKLGTRSPTTLLLMSNLANTYSDLGQIREAIELHQELLTLRTDQLGAEHRDTLRSINYLAVAFGKVGRVEDAAAMYSQLLGIQKRQLGKTNTTTIATMSHLAEAYTKLTRFHDAQEPLKDLLSVRRQLHGIDHKETLQTAYSLSATYLRLKKLPEAEELLSEILPKLDRVLGKRHDYSTRGLSYLASVYEQQGRWKEAEAQEAELLQRRKEFLGDSHPSTLTSMKALSIIYQRQRRWQEADDIEESIKRLTRDLDSSTLRSGSDTAEGRAYDETEYFTAELAPASSEEEIITNAVAKVLGVEHPESIESMEAEAIIHLDHQRWSKAEPILTKILPRRREVQGDNHLFTIRTMSNLGWAYHGQGKLQEAIEIFQEALDTLGSSHTIADPRFQTEITDRLSAAYSQLDDPENSTLRSTKSNTGSNGRMFITSTMTADEIMACLTSRSCPDLTKELDEAQCLPDRNGIRTGAAGDVWRGALLDGSSVALKRVYRDSKLLKYLARELYAWSKARHENVLELMGMAYWDNNLVMVSPWMEFGSVNDYLSEHPQVSRLGTATRVAEGLAYLHQIPLIHGDIKAKNVFVSRNGEVKIGDFGVAILLGEQSIEFSSTVLQTAGTIRWMAPELLEEGCNSTHETDIYALGMTILELLTGKLPFHELSNAMQVIVAVRVQGRKPSRPAEIHSMSRRGDRLWELLNRCWDKEPSLRPAADQVLREPSANHLNTTTMRLYSLSILQVNASKATNLVTANDLSTFSFYQKGSVAEFMAFFTGAVAERTPAGQRQSIQEKSYTFHVYNRGGSDNLVGVLISDEEYPVRPAFSLLAKALDDFATAVPSSSWSNPSSISFPQAATYVAKYQDPKQADSIMKVQQELDETKIVLHKTIEAVLERGEKLDDLVDRSNNLSATSKQFYKTAKKQNSCCVIA